MRDTIGGFDLYNNIITLPILLFNKIPHSRDVPIQSTWIDIVIIYFTTTQCLYMCVILLCVRPTFTTQWCFVIWWDSFTRSPGKLLSFGYKYYCGYLFISRLQQLIRDCCRAIWTFSHFSYYKHNFSITLENIILFIEIIFNTLYEFFSNLRLSKILK